MVDKVRGRRGGWSGVNSYLGFKLETIRGRD